MPHLIGSVGVFCGSSPGREGIHAAEARRLGQLIGASGRRLVYGGGGIGLMGVCARAVAAEGGRVTGVIPRFLCTPEVALDAGDLRVVESMHERKAAMFEAADGFAVLPGGVGTLEEAIELLSWGRLNLHRKPVVFLDTGGFWQPLFALVEHTVAEGFTPAAFKALYRSVARSEEVLDALEAMAAEAGRGGPSPIDLF